MGAWDLFVAIVVLGTVVLGTAYLILDEVNYGGKRQYHRQEERAYDNCGWDCDR